MWKLIILVTALTSAVNLTDVSFYEILGVAKQATTQEIRQAYKKLAKIYHPDKNPGSAEQEKFIKISEAYETLKDPDKRHKYDEEGSNPQPTKKYEYQTQSEYNRLFYNGLYHDDPFVDTLSEGGFNNYLQEGFHFINFYSPFCPPCQHLVSTWKKLAEIYKGIVKIGAVNCMLHNTFCYHTIRVPGYPSLFLYPYGKNGKYIDYEGDRSLQALEKLLMRYIKNQVQIPTVSRIMSTDQPIAYVLGSIRLEDFALARIAYHLNGIVTVNIVEDYSVREQLTKDESVNVVFKYKDITKYIDSTEEKVIVKEIVGALPEVQFVGPEELEKIRTELRNGSQVPWGLFFSNEMHNDRLHLYQMQISHPEMRFGEIDCDEWLDLCASLQVEDPPAWGVLKPGGAYQTVVDDPRTNVPIIAQAKKVHSLSVADLDRILAEESGTWVLLVAPYKRLWQPIVMPFTSASMKFADDDTSFGIMACTKYTDQHCRKVTHELAIVVKNGTLRHYLYDSMDEPAIVDFMMLLKETADIQLTEQQVLELLSDTSRTHTWLVAFMPTRCGNRCELLMKEWRLVAKKLRPLDFVRVGVLQCAAETGFCANVRVATAKIYPISSSHHYSTSLEQNRLTAAAYMLHWALELIDETMNKLNWQTFNKLVAAEELNPAPGKKPWLVYFHSPRCHHCYEMYADFAIAGIMLNNAVQLGKVNCVNERSLCQHEQVMGYPTLRLYLGRNQHHSVSSTVGIPLGDYESVLSEIKPHIRKYDANLLSGIDDELKRQMRHDEF